MSYFGVHRLQFIAKIGFVLHFLIADGADFRWFFKPQSLKEPKKFVHEFSQIFTDFLATECKLKMPKLPKVPKVPKVPSGADKGDWWMVNGEW